MAARSIPYVNLKAQYAEERDQLLPLLDQAMAEADYVGGRAVELLEQALAKQLGVAHVVALNSGTDALIFAMIGLGIGQGDEVITPPNSFVASTGAIVQAGATPVFADVLPDQNIDPAAVERAITPRTKAIMPVHLTGRVADMQPLQELARRHNLFLIEDAAQSIGSLYAGRQSGTIGDVGCFSAHPLKNLNAAGDAGFLVTDRAPVADTARLLRSHGMQDRNTVVRFGTVSRLDTLQAVILTYRLGRLPWIIERRRANAAAYAGLLDLERVFVPPERQIEFNTYHTFVVQVPRRDELRAHLAGLGVGTAIHYPVPIHLQPAAAHLGHKEGDFPVTERQAGRILTLPIHPWLSEDDIAFVAGAVNNFVSKADA